MRQTIRSFTPDTIASDAVFTAVDPDGMLFAVVSSSMFLTWQKTIGERLKSDPRFSNTLVWNNLPLPRITGAIRTQIIDAGNAVEAARANHPAKSLADLYEPGAIPADLLQTHRHLDDLVDVAFGAAAPCNNELQRQEVLFARYAELTSPR